MAKRKRKAARAAAVQAEGLAKAYGEARALAPLDVSIEAGQLVALIGHNGSGKSTFLRLAAGLLDPTDGAVSVHGHVAGSRPARARLSYLSDTPVLYDDLSVWEHVEYVARLHDTDGWEDLGAELIDAFGLAERADDLPSGFSRGLRQKTALVLGLVRDHSVLLVDEPFSGLDASGKAALLERLEHREPASTAVIATHDLELVERVDRCLVLRDGELVHDGKVDPADLLAFAG